MGVSDLFSLNKASKQSQGSTLEKILLRSNNVIASLKDLVANNQITETGLQEMLMRSKNLENTNLPKGDVHKLDRTGRWWFNANTLECAAEEYDAFIATEAILNISQDVEALKNTHASETDLQLVRTTLSQVASIMPKSSSLTEQVAPFSGGADGSSDWMKRLWFANYVENTPFPFRMVYNFSYNPQLDILVFEFFVARPRCFSFLSTEKSEQIAAARAYALRTSLCVARMALQSCKISRVCINGSLRGEDRIVISMDLNEAALARLLPTAANTQIDSNSFPQDPALRVSFDTEGWFNEVEPFMKPTDEWVSPRSFFEVPDLSDRPCSAAVTAVCGAQKVSDLEYSEAAHRIKLWNTTLNNIPKDASTADVVSQLEGAKASTSDIYAIEGLDRVIHGLVEGTIDFSDRRTMAEKFLFGSPLSKTLETIKNIMDGEPDPDALEKTLTELESQVSPTLDMGLYLDDSDSIYRYFDSISERIAYNLAFPNEPRKLVLIPDTYFMSLARMARAYNLLEQSEKAERYAQEAHRISPLGIDATLLLVRTLEDQSKIFEAAKLLKNLIQHLFSSSDVALVYYRLAYMEWKLGRSDLCAACYQMAIIIGGNVAQPAKEELKDLLKTDSSVKTLDTPQEVFSFLEQNDIPVFDQKTVFNKAVAIASACVNDGVYCVGQNMLKSCLEITFDDAAAKVESSLRSPY